MTAQNGKWKRHAVKGLTILLILTVCLAVLQWFIIKEIIRFRHGHGKRCTDSTGNQRVWIGTTLRLPLIESKTAGMQLPFSFLTRKINLRKIRAVGRYAIEANRDEVWDADEINTLLRMMNASVGFKGGTE